MPNVAFPEGFVWGTATASYQVEGATDADGRGPSIWDTFSRTPGKVHNGETGDIACDHYHRLEADLDLMADLGLRSYRFSVAWPRVQPDGRGPFNQAGLDFYRRLVDGLVARGIEPSPTLYHWDLPQTLEDDGGWTNREVAERFGEYSAAVARALGSDVTRWITLNEPWCAAWLGYALGIHAPGLQDVGKAAAATHHLLLGHARAVEALRAELGQDASIGITLNLADVQPVSDHPDDQGAARRVDGNANRIWLDPIFKGSYPADVLEEAASWQPGFGVMADGDLAATAAPIDFLGVNYYTPNRVAGPERINEARLAGYVVVDGPGGVFGEALQAVPAGIPGTPRTAMGWEVEAAGLERLLARLRRDYPPIPLYITENGAAYEDYRDHQGEVLDTERIEYLDAHLRAVAQAIADGSDVRGYFAWSLMDNFEWAEGYSKRFGLVYVDYPTLERFPKASYHWYRQVIADNGIAERPGA